RSRGAAWLLLSAGVAWFVGDFHATGPGWLGSFATTLAWVFLAPLVQLGLAFPSGWPRTRPAAVAVVAAWAAVVAPWLDWNDDTTLATAMGALALVGITESLRRSGRVGRDAIGGDGALLLLVAWAVVVPLLAANVQPIAFDAGVAVVGVWLFAWLRPSVDLAERAIELDESAGTLRAALAELLGDPELQVGFATDGAGFVDDRGRSVPTEVHGRTTTE